MGCFDSGSQSTTTTVALPAWLEEAAQYNIDVARDISQRPYEAYQAPRIAPFTGDQLQAFDLIRGAAPQFTGPTGNVDQIQMASSAPYMQFDTPLTFDPITGAGGQTYSFDDYMNPYISSVVADTIGEINRQADSARKGLDTQATMAGAFGDTGHAVQRQELERNVMDMAGQAANRGYAQAFDSAVGTRQADINRLLSAFQTNLGSYEGALNRAITGGATAAGTQGQDLSNFLNYVGALNQSGAQQQMLGQQSLDTAYGDFLRQWNYPIEMLNILNQTTGMQPHGQTTTGETPTASPFAQALGTASTIGSFFI